MLFSVIDSVLSDSVTVLQAKDEEKFEYFKNCRKTEEDRKFFANGDCFNKVIGTNGRMGFQKEGINILRIFPLNAVLRHSNLRQICRQSYRLTLSHQIFPSG